MTLTFLFLTKQKRRALSHVVRWLCFVFVNKGKVLMLVVYSHKVARLVKP